jgi:hypothetical protein
VQQFGRNPARERAVRQGPQGRDCCDALRALLGCSNGPVLVERARSGAQLIEGHNCTASSVNSLPSGES